MNVEDVENASIAKKERPCDKMGLITQVVDHLAGFGYKIQ